MSNNTIKDDEFIRYRKKSKTSSKSSSNKRADHKHKYEKIILQWIFGYKWSKRCSVCGRIDSVYGSFSTMHHEDFLKPEALKKPGISNRDFLSVAEIRAKFPGVDIYKIDTRVEHGGWQYIKLDDAEGGPRG